jgi:phthiocerol/phenolphthiocerol synthesis type-I polyketide synthase E
MGSLASVPSVDEVNPPVPPTIAYFLEHGLWETGRWCMPVILRLNSKVAAADVEAVLTAVTNHHDALRLKVVEHAGSWEQRIAAPYESVRPAQRSLPDGVNRGTDQERETLLGILAEGILTRDMSNAPVNATYIVDSQGDPRFLAITILELVADSTSREILLTDIFTAFAQRLAGEEIVLPPATTTWREWSQRCVALVTHPAVLESRDYWLDNSGGATKRLAEGDFGDRTAPDDLARLPSIITTEQTNEIDRVRRRFQFTLEEVLLAALGRTIAHTIGGGVVAINLAGDGRSVLKPDVDPRRTVGQFSTIYPIPLKCATPESVGAIQALDDVRDTLKAVPHHGIGHGLLRYLYAPTARILGLVRPPDIFMCNEGVIPDLPAGDGPVQFDVDAAMPVRDKLPGLGHAIEMRVYRSSAGLHVDWWYDTRRMQRQRAEALLERFPVVLTELIEEAMASGRADSGLGANTEELTLVDLSAE